MSLKEHKVQNVRIDEITKSKIQSLGEKISRVFNLHRKLDYYIQSSDGTIWGDLYLKDLISLYSADREEYMLYYKETKDEDVLYHNLINNTYLTPQEFFPLYDGAFSVVNIKKYVSKEDILFENVLPTIDGQALKEKVEANKKITGSIVKKKVNL